MSRVLERLQDEGWGEELDMMGDEDMEELFYLDGVSRTSKLTDKGQPSIALNIKSCP